MRGKKSLTPLQEFELRQFREAGVSIRDCALYFQVGEATVYRVLAKQRRTFGPPKLKREQSARWHLIARNILGKVSQA